MEGLRNRRTRQSNAFVTDMSENNMFSKERSSRERDTGKRYRESSYNNGGYGGDGGYAITQQLRDIIGEVVTAREAQMLIELKEDIKASETRMMNQVKEMMRELKE